MKIYIDDLLGADFRPRCKISWQQFREIPLRIKELTIGEYTTTLKFPEDLEEENGIAFLIGELTLKER